MGFARVRSELSVVAGTANGEEKNGDEGKVSRCGLGLSLRLFEGLP